MDPRASDWASGERERHNVDGQEWGSKYFSSVRSLAPSHTQTLSNLFEPLQIKWEVIIFIKKSSCVFIIASVCIQYIYVYFCMNQLMTNAKGVVKASYLGEANSKIKTRRKLQFQTSADFLISFVRKSPRKDPLK